MHILEQHHLMLGSFAGRHNLDLFMNGRRRAFLSANWPRYINN